MEDVIVEQRESHSGLHRSASSAEEYEMIFRHTSLQTLVEAEDERADAVVRVDRHDIVFGWVSAS